MTTGPTATRTVGGADTAIGLHPADRVRDESERDEDLMAAYVAGDMRAFARLFDRMVPKLHAFFGRSFRDRATTEDLVQGTFLRLHAVRSSYRPEAPLRPWLFTIAARVRVDALRRRYRLPGFASEDEIDSAFENERPKNAADRIEDAQLAERVRAAVESLPPSQRVVVELHRFEGLTFPEIATALGATEGAIRVRACRAYETLRTRLSGIADDGMEG